MRTQTQNTGYGQFRYVDFASAKQPNFRNNVVPIEDVPSLLKTNKSFECYSTYFLFTDDLNRYMKTNIINGRKSVSGYRGPLYAYYFPLDIDFPKDLGFSREAAIETLDKFRNDIGIPDYGINIYFSGKKGFHLMADTRSFDVSPSPELNLHFARMRKSISLLIGEYGKTIDRQISDSVRLWRIPNTLNAKSGLYKIQLSSDELSNLSTGQIKSMARHKRPIWGTDLSGLLPLYPVQLSQKAKGFYQENANKISQSVHHGFNSNSKRPLQKDGHQSDFRMCPAMDKIYNSKIAKGNRNNAAIILASYFLNRAGEDTQKTQSEIFEWNRINSIGLSESELTRIIRSAERGKYRFGCKSLADYCPYKDPKDCDFNRKFHAKMNQ